MQIAENRGQVPRARGQQQGIWKWPGQINAVKEWATPKSQNELQTVLGFVGYYRQFCPEYTTIVKPLNRLTSEGVHFEWTETEEAALQQLRQYLIEAPVLAHPDPR